MLKKQTKKEIDKTWTEILKTFKNLKRRKKPTIIIISYELISGQGCWGCQLQEIETNFMQVDKVIEKSSVKKLNFRIETLKPEEKGNDQNFVQLY